MRRSIFALTVPFLLVTQAQAQTFSPDDLNRRMIERRAVEAVIWGMPVVNTDLMRQQMLTKTSGKVGQVIYWGRPLDSKNQTLTPNPDALYFASRSSQIPELQKNADGSIDIFIGPKAPVGKDANWLPTDPARKFELMARFYGPKKEFFEKKWVLPDVEKLVTESGGTKP